MDNNIVKQFKLDEKHKYIFIFSVRKSVLRNIIYKSNIPFFYFVASCNTTHHFR